MTETKDYFFFAINPDQTVTAFRSKLEHSDLAGIETNQEKFKKANCTAEQYGLAATAVRKLTLSIIRNVWGKSYIVRIVVGG